MNKKSLAVKIIIPLFLGFLLSIPAILILHHAESLQYYKTVVLPRMTEFEDKLWIGLKAINPLWITGMCGVAVLIAFFTLDCLFGHKDEKKER